MVIFRLYFRVIVKPKEKGIDVVNYRGKGKYEVLYLQTNVLRKVYMMALLFGECCFLYFLKLSVGNSNFVPGKLVAFLDFKLPANIL